MTEEYRELTKEEAKKMTLSELESHINKRPKLITVNDEYLNENLQKLINESQSELRGEYEIYCIYQKPLGSTVRYALTYAEYVESEELKYEDINRIIFEDGNLIHDKLKAANLECDYFYIMPYFEFIDKNIGSVLFNNSIYLTNEKEEFKKILNKK